MRWWLAANGALALTRDGGGTWTPIASGVATDLLCGAATSDRVVWIGGRSGTLLRSLDGISFAPVPGPTAEDVTAITASDSRRATITTASGARFATEDGGASWRRL